MLNFYPNLNKREAVSPVLSTSASNNRKKIRDYSYCSADRIGKGFSSVVYRGTNDLTNEIVAIKAIDMKGIKDAISREMLQCEIQALKTVNHANVLNCFDVVRETSHCYIITEYCNQGDLSGLLKKKRKMPEEETMRILKDIVQGFVEIGEKGFLHRDLKLANIFMNNDRAKIADFGFAKKIRFSSEKEKYNVGSPLYMSPEALKKNIYSLKNDIWSIGVMAYEMLHGETPWECKTQKELIDKMTRIPVKFRDSLNISEPLKAFIKKCLEVDDTRRMSLENLKEWIGSVPTKSFNPLALRQENMPLPPKLNLSHKPNSNIDKISSTYQTEYSQRLTARSQRENAQNKQNAVTGRSSGLGTIPKSMIEKNNGILVNEINTFRLIYKIMDKLKKMYNGETELIRTLGQEVIRRVTELKTFCDDGKDKQGYGLSMVESYLNERANPTVKKYKSVISEYYKKYTSEIPEKPYQYKWDRVTSEMLAFMSKSIPQMESEEDFLICYWMVELSLVSKETSKEKLDAIIEPRLKLKKSYIEQRIKELH